MKRGEPSGRGIVTGGERHKGWLFLGGWIGGCEVLQCGGMVVMVRAGKK